MVKAFLPALIIFLALAPTVSAQTVVINEFLPKPDDNTEWVELYNPTDQVIDLTGWILKDGNSSTSDDISLSGQVTPFGFKTFDHSKGWLNDSGPETITLVNGSNSVDSYSYDGVIPGQSFGRQPDGGGWTTLTSSSKGSTNGAASTPSPTSPPSSNPTPTTQSSNFTISNIPSSINSNQSFSVGVDLNLSNNPNTTFYLKGAFKKSDNSNYFGLTKVGSSWIKNGNTYSEQFPITTDSSGHWSGNIEVQPDPEDSGFEGSGRYIFKVGRYSSSGSGPTWSNEATITINHTSPTTTPAPIKSGLTPTPSLKASAGSTGANAGNIKTNLASVAGIIKESTPSSTSASIPSNPPNPPNPSHSGFTYLPLIGAGFILIGSSAVYIYRKQKLQSKL